ncbi:TetR/AcrR family transcriptional regulator, partial [bacterium]|nr:TetR/AcrR family transcriptional regulator [bacterium]
MTKRQKFDLDETRIKVIELLLRHQPHDLSFSKVSRFTGVPRSTLYYYFGSNFKDLLDDAVTFGISKFTQIETIDDYKSYDSWEKFQFARLKRAVTQIRLYPWAPLLFMRFRIDNGALGENIRLMEKKFLRGHRQVWKHFHKNEANTSNERLV